jgi:hypothetical protein
MSGLAVASSPLSGLNSSASSLDTVHSSVLRRKWLTSPLAASTRMVSGPIAGMPVNGLRMPAIGIDITAIASATSVSRTSMPNRRRGFRCRTGQPGCVRV